MAANMKPLLVAIVMTFLCEGALADADNTSTARTSSVAEMLQRRQEHQLREQLAKEGRWDEVRQMDDEQLRRQQVQKKQALTKVNAELAREGTVESQVNGDGVYTFCAPLRPPSKLEASKYRSDPASDGTDTSKVR
jgi:hypothetical protein